MSDYPTAYRSPAAADKANPSGFQRQSSSDAARINARTPVSPLPTTGYPTLKDFLGDLAGVARGNLLAAFKLGWDLEGLLHPYIKQPIIRWRDEGGYVNVPAGWTECPTPYTFCVSSPLWQFNCWDFRHLPGSTWGCTGYGACGPAANGAPYNCTTYNPATHNQALMFWWAPLFSGRNNFIKQYITAKLPGPSEAPTWVPPRDPKWIPITPELPYHESPPLEPPYPDSEPLPLEPAKQPEPEPLPDIAVPADPESNPFPFEVPAGSPEGFPERFPAPAWAPEWTPGFPEYVPYPTPHPGPGVAPAPPALFEPPSPTRVIPETAKEPFVQTEVDPGAKRPTNRTGRSLRRPPGRKTRERKVVTSIPNVIKHVVNGITETKDFIDALWKGIDKAYRTPKADLFQKMDDIADRIWNGNPGEIKEMLVQLIANEINDNFYGRIGAKGREAAKTAGQSGYYNRSVGFQTGDRYRPQASQRSQDSMLERAVRSAIEVIW